jgi:hypothetical protein
MENAGAIVSAAAGRARVRRGRGDLADVDRPGQTPDRTPDVTA